MPRAFNRNDMLVASLITTNTVCDAQSRRFFRLTSSVVLCSTEGFVFRKAMLSAGLRKAMLSACLECPLKRMMVCQIVRPLEAWN